MDWRSTIRRVGVVAGLGFGLPLALVGPALADPRVDYAPEVYLQADETHWPLSATTFVNHSSLKWDHERCGAGTHVIASMGNVNASSMASAYNHVEGLCPYRTFEHNGTRYYADGPVRPYFPGGPRDREGMFLNLDDSYRDGQGLAPNGQEEPVYTRFISGNRLEYWFNYGNSHVFGCPGCTHEGDWEHIAIKLNGLNTSAPNTPTWVEFFYHHDSCTLPWSAVRKSSTGHPIVRTAREAHGSYPENGIAPSWPGDDIRGSVLIWEAWRNVDRLGDVPWWGYAGGWGSVGEFSDTTGPMGPGVRQDAPTFDTSSSNRCATTS